MLQARVITHGHGPAASESEWRMRDVPRARPGTAVEVALLDPDGVIVAVNDAWAAFGRAGGGDPARTGVGASYLDACEAAGDDPAAQDVAAAVRAAVRGDLPAALRLEVPCHGPDADGWYDVLVSSRLADDGSCLGATVTLSLVASPNVGGRPGLTRLLGGLPGLVDGRTDPLDDVPAAACELLGAHTAVLSLLADDGRLASVRQVGRPPGDRPVLGERPAALGLLGLLLARSRPLRLGDVAVHPAAARAVGSGALLGAPVSVHGRVVGAVYVVGDRPGGFTDHDEAVLAALAALAGTAADALRRRAARDARLRWAELARELTARPVTGEPELLALVVRLAGRGLGAQDTALVLAGADGAAAVTRSRGGERAAADGAADPVVSGVLSTGRARRGAPGDATAAAVPLRIGGRVLGALAVARATSLDDEELRELVGLAHHAGLALQLVRGRSERRALQALHGQVARAAESQDGAVQRLFALALDLAGSGASDRHLPVLDEVVQVLRSSALALHLATEESVPPAAELPRTPSGGPGQLAVVPR